MQASRPYRQAADEGRLCHSSLHSRGDPEWLKLKAVPEYADKEIVSTIANHVLTPAAYSEV